VPVATELSFTSVDGGDKHTCGLTDGGYAYCSGHNGLGQLGNGTTEKSIEPVVVTGGHSFVSLAAGYYHTCGLTASGTAYCWGDNSEGVLGIGVQGGAYSYPVKVYGNHEFEALAAWGAHMCALTPDGDVYCWGRNWSGQLARSTDLLEESPVPVLVEVP
jgi:alpha-tubulin suppressor-like RCC1 family protein